MQKAIKFFTMKPARLAASIVLAALVSGCAASGGTRVDTIERRNSELAARLAETNSRLEELSNKFSLLHEKVEADREKEREAVKGNDAAMPVEPPSGLKVITLGEAPSTARPAKAEGTAARTAPAAQAPDELYNRGQDFFLAGSYAEARAVFLEFVRLYPAHDLADNSLYWAAETHYAEQDYQRALDSFKAAAYRYPDGNKAPDAMLKVGYSYMELGDEARARAALEALARTHPKSPAAHKAVKTLEMLAGAKKEG